MKTTLKVLLIPIIFILGCKPNNNEKSSEINLIADWYAEVPSDRGKLTFNNNGTWELIVESDYENFSGTYQFVNNNLLRINYSKDYNEIYRNVYPEECSKSEYEVIKTDKGIKLSPNYDTCRVQFILYGHEWLKSDDSPFTWNEKFKLEIALSKEGNGIVFGKVEGASSYKISCGIVEGDPYNERSCVTWHEPGTEIELSTITDGLISDENFFSIFKGWQGLCQNTPNIYLDPTGGYCYYTINENTVLDTGFLPANEIFSSDDLLGNWFVKLNFYEAPIDDQLFNNVNQIDACYSFDKMKMATLGAGKSQDRVVGNSKLLIYGKSPFSYSTRDGESSANTWNGENFELILDSNNYDVILKSTFSKNNSDSYNLSGFSYSRNNNNSTVAKNFEIQELGNKVPIVYWMDGESETIDVEYWTPNGTINERVSLPWSKAIFVEKGTVSLKAGNLDSFLNKQISVNCTVQKSSGGYGESELNYTLN